MRTKPEMSENGWLRKSIESATMFAERNKDWADTIARNWDREPLPSADSGEPAGDVDRSSVKD
jgi:hypothetical protein